MNYSTVRGYSAYALISAKVREAVQNRNSDDGIKADRAEGLTASSSKSEALQDSSRITYSEPVDTVTISEPARNASKAMMVLRDTSSATRAPEQRTPYTQFREWLRTSGIASGRSGVMTGTFSHKVPGSVMNDALLGSGISVGDNEEYSINIDVLSTVTVSGKNAEKAKAIQDLLRSTPSNINWGLLLATLPPG